jgi:hypothetical protein
MTTSSVPGVLPLVFLSILLAPACGGDSGGDSGDPGSDVSDATEGDTSTTDGGDAGNDFSDGALVDGLGDGGDAPAQDTEPAGPPCNPYTQEGCEEGDKCTFDSFDNIVCDEAGQKALNEECSGSGDCEAGSLCTSLIGTDSYCYGFCKIDAHCAGGVTCLSLQDSAFKLCEIEDIYENCTLLADTCEAGKGCYLATGDGPICLPSGTGGSKDSCEGANDCAPTHTCINKVCLPLCKTAAPSPCGDAFTPCVSYYWPQQIGYCDI